VPLDKEDPMQTKLSGREVLVGGTAAARAAAAPGRAAAQAKELVANTYGGGWEAGHRAAIAQPLEKRLGIKVTLVSMLAAELVARTKAAASGRPPVDVALVDDGPFLLAIKEDVFQRLPMDRIPNAKRIYAKYRPKEPFGVPIGASQIGIAYNAKKLKTRPVSWADLWNPEYKGRLGLSTPASTLGTVTLLSFASLKGGNEGNIEPGFEAVKSLLPSVSSIQAVPANLPVDRGLPRQSPHAPRARRDRHRPHVAPRHHDREDEGYGRGVRAPQGRRHRGPSLARHHQGGQHGSRDRVPEPGTRSRQPEADGGHPLVHRPGDRRRGGLRRRARDRARDAGGPRAPQDARLAEDQHAAGRLDRPLESRDQGLSTPAARGPPAAAGPAPPALA